MSYDSDGVLVPCTELRFYSLTRSDNYGLGILFEAGGMGDAEYYSSEVFFVTPDAAEDVGGAQAPPVRGLITPDALNDIQGVHGPQQADLGTPDALSDINAVKELVTGGG